MTNALIFIVGIFALLEAGKQTLFNQRKRVEIRNLEYELLELRNRANAAEVALKKEKTRRKEVFNQIGGLFHSEREEPIDFPVILFSRSKEYPIVADKCKGNKNKIIFADRMRTEVREWGKSSLTDGGYIWIKSSDINHISKFSNH